MDWDFQFLTVDGVRVRYTVVGEGPALVLVHGLGASLACWWENIGPLSRHFRVFALDMPGQGLSDGNLHPYDDPRNGARFLVHFMDAVGVRQAVVVGNSGGGFIAALCAIEHPERVEKLVLVDTPTFERTVSIFLRLASIPLVGEALHLRTLPNAAVMNRELFPSDHSMNESAARELLAVRNSRRVRTASVRAIRRFASPFGVRGPFVLLEPLKLCKAPILIVWGEKDRVAPVSQANAAASALPNAVVRIFSGCGHWPQMERADEFNKLVCEFADNHRT